MTLDGLLFLAACTTRSQAYAQAMAKAGLKPESVVIFGKAPPARSFPSLPSPAPAELGDLHLPDYNEPLAATCTRADWSVETCSAASVNDAGIATLLREKKPKVVLYSGYGGQLVSPEILGCGAKFLHLHAGWLPDFAGSTTIYYSWLEEQRCGVTALLLDKNIDSGPIVARRHYPVPPAGLDVDHLYDGSIRADLLVRVLKDYMQRGEFAVIEAPPALLPFYVIHPVLKHLALMSRDEGGALSGSSRKG